MQNKLKRRGQVFGESAAAVNAVSRRPLPADGVIDIGPALECSWVTTLSGRPYPIQFRNQGAIDAWTRALGKTEVWQRWQDPGTLCWQIRQEVLRQLERVDSLPPVSDEMAKAVADDQRRLAVEISTNLKYHLNQGTVIETTAALETLLTNSDVDLSLPMSMVAPPYRAQYLRFGDAAMRYLKVPASQAPDRCFDGVFCFLTPHSVSCASGTTCWTLELVFVSKRQDRYSGYVSLLGETDRGNSTVGEWLSGVLLPVSGQSEGEFHQPMHAAVSYVVRVFLYMALAQARVVRHTEYDEALRRAAGLGDRKRAKLLQRSASLYNRILIGPESLPSTVAAGGTGHGVAAHWRRGHFRMQPHGERNQQRKLVFIAPVLVHAEHLQDEVPVPKSYRAGAVALTGA
jgi:hypothetical protein